MYHNTKLCIIYNSASIYTSMTLYTVGDIDRQKANNELISVIMNINFDIANTVKNNNHTKAM